MRGNAAATLRSSPIQPESASEAEQTGLKWECLLVTYTLTRKAATRRITD